MAPGLGKIIIPESIVIKWIYGTVPYATNTNFLFRNPSSLSSINCFSLTQPNNIISYQNSFGYDVIENEKLEVSVSIGNPTAGDSTMEITMYYKIHTTA